MGIHEEQRERERVRKKGVVSGGGNEKRGEKGKEKIERKKEERQEKEKSGRKRREKKKREKSKAVSYM